MIVEQNYSALKFPLSAIFWLTKESCRIVFVYYYIQWRFSTFFFLSSHGQNKMEMKKLYFTLLLSLFAFVGCKEKTPGEVAVMLFNSITVGDADVVKQNIHFKEIDEYEVFCEYLDMVVASDNFKNRTKGYTADYVAVSEVVDGDTAYVELLGYTVLKQKTRFNVRLLKIDGDWKVDGDQAVLNGVGPAKR